MAQEKRSRLAEWLDILRRQGPVVRQQVGDWVDEVREEPRLLWETPTVRYATYGLAGLLVLSFASAMVGMFVPELPPMAQDEATSADFHVICSNSDCNQHFVIHRPFGFRRFPVQCVACKNETGRPAQRCVSKSCDGRWSLPRELERRRVCTRCGDPFD